MTWRYEMELWHNDRKGKYTFTLDLGSIADLDIPVFTHLLHFVCSSSTTSDFVEIILQTKAFELF